MGRHNSAGCERPLAGIPTLGTRSPWPRWPHSAAADENVGRRLPEFNSTLLPASPLTWSKILTRVSGRTSSPACHNVQYSSPCAATRPIRALSASSVRRLWVRGTPRVPLSSTCAACNAAGRVPAPNRLARLERRQHRIVLHELVHDPHLPHLRCVDRGAHKSADRERCPSRAPRSRARASIAADGLMPSHPRIRKPRSEELLVVPPLIRSIVFQWSQRGLDGDAAMYVAAAPRATALTNARHLPSSFSSCDFRPSSSPCQGLGDASPSRSPRSAAGTPRSQ